MKTLCFLLAWLVPGGILYLRERKEIRLRRHWESQGNELQAPIFWQRTRNAKKMAAGVYAVILFSLQSFFYYSIRDEWTGVFVAFVSCVIAIIGYEAALKLAMKGQEAGKFNAQVSLRDFHTNYRKPQPPLVSAKEHGSSAVLAAEDNGLADPDALSLGERGSQR